LDEGGCKKSVVLAREGWNIWDHIISVEGVAADPSECNVVMVCVPKDLKGFEGVLQFDRVL